MEEKRHDEQLRHGWRARRREGMHTSSAKQGRARTHHGDKKRDEASGGAQVTLLPTAQPCRGDCQSSEAKKVSPDEKFGVIFWFLKNVWAAKLGLPLKRVEWGRSKNGTMEVAARESQS
jgi:hypothetical protein